MDSEDDCARPSPKRPYTPSTAQLRVPLTAISATLELLQRAGRRESGLFWYGPKQDDGSGNVAYLVAPRQRMSWGNYLISAEALAQVVYSLPQGWKPLAQVHSHPGRLVEHSNFDDRMTSSRRALSLVFPSYGRLSGVFPDGVGIHEWQKDYWYLLDCALAKARVVAVNGDVKVDDFR